MPAPIVPYFAPFLDLPESHSYCRDSGKSGPRFLEHSQFLGGCLKKCGCQDEALLQRSTKYKSSSTMLGCSTVILARMSPSQRSMANQGVDMRGRSITSMYTVCTVSIPWPRTRVSASTTALEPYNPTNYLVPACPDTVPRRILLFFGAGWRQRQFAALLSIPFRSL